MTTTRKVFAAFVVLSLLGAQYTRMNPVQVPDLADGTDGELLTWDTAGKATTLSVGTSGEVLKSNGAGNPPTFQGESVTASNTVTFTNKTFDANATGNSLLNVDVADLANGTDGKIITWDASGVATSVGPGTTGQVLKSNGAGAAPTFQRLASIVIVVDEKTANTAGGTFTSGAWQTRVLNTLRVNDATIASLASNQVTLPAGTYECWISAPAIQVDRHMIRLRDTTAGSTIITGTSEISLTTDLRGTRSFLYHKFTISVSSALEVQHRCQTTKTTNGFGLEGNFSVVETYAVAMFRKVDL